MPDLHSRKWILEQLGIVVPVGRQIWSHDRGDAIIFDAWEDEWELDEQTRFARYPLRTNGRHYNPREAIDNPRPGHTRWQEHVDMVVHGQRNPLAILPVRRGFDSEGAKGWHSFFVQGHVDIDDEGQVWLRADRVIRTLEGVNTVFDRAVQQAIGSPNLRQDGLVNTPANPRRIEVQTTVFERSPYVVAEVLLIANGYCQQCNQPAPFKRRIDGSPYLEVHHRLPLSEGGKDTVANAIALCPNCHRAAHYG